MTTLGDTLVAFVILLPVLRVRPQMATAALLAAIPAGLVCHAFKHWCDVERPAHVLGNSIHIVGPRLMEGSFPSGHTTTAFLLAAVVITGLRSRALAGTMATGAFLVGVSRVAVGAHWPIDVAGGMIIGWTSGLFGVWLVRRPQLRIHIHSTHLAAFRLFLVACALWLLIGYNSHYPLARPFQQLLALCALLLGLVPRWRVLTCSPFLGPRDA
jgi:membrane-associated phospholipid phosphatase